MENGPHITATDMKRKRALELRNRINEINLEEGLYSFPLVLKKYPLNNNKEEQEHSYSREQFISSSPIKVTRDLCENRRENRKKSEERIRENSYDTKKGHKNTEKVEKKEDRVKEDEKYIKEKKRNDHQIHKIRPEEVKTNILKKKMENQYREQLEQRKNKMRQEYEKKMENNNKPVDTCSCNKQTWFENKTTPEKPKNKLKDENHEITLDFEKCKNVILKNKPEDKLYKTNLSEEAQGVARSSVDKLEYMYAPKEQPKNQKDTIRPSRGKPAFSKMAKRTICSRCKSEIDGIVYLNWDENLCFNCADRHYNQVVGKRDQDPAAPQRRRRY